MKYEGCSIKEAALWEQLLYDYFQGFAL